MGSGLRESLPDNLRKQLALAVRSIQWTYAIFWSTSAQQTGILEWGEGYYNGDIKTRKIIQAIELDANQMGLQRSEQLRELYGSLLDDEANPQARRPATALSPEDLTDTEWYYLVCMSFMFNIGQGLPGKSFANDQPKWLCNAPFADSKVFTRSLLAKSASIQTVVCFPCLGGVVELGVTELVLEDPGLIQHIKTTFLEVPYSVVLKNIKLAPRNTRNDQDIVSTALDRETDTKLIKLVGCEEPHIASAKNSSDGLEPNQPVEGSFMDRKLNGGNSREQSLQFMEKEFSNCAHQSASSSDCISQTSVESEKVETAVSGSHGGNFNRYCMADQGCDQMRTTTLELQNDELHYHSILSVLLKSSHQFILGPHSERLHKESGFVSWRKGLVSFPKSRDVTPQKLLKKVLFEVPRMHIGGLLKSWVDNGYKDRVWRPQADEIGINHALLENEQREKLNERFVILRSLVPSIRKDDELSILDEAIDYLKELERRVEKLESCRTESETRTKRRPQDRAERTSENRGNDKISNSKKPLVTKRKSWEIDEAEQMIDYISSFDGSSDDVNVCISNKDVVIEMKCPSREGLLLEIMDVGSNLLLDSHSVQSSIAGGILSLTIKSKFNSSSIASVGIIKQALQRIARKCGSFLSH